MHFAPQTQVLAQVRGLPIALALAPNPEQNMAFPTDLTFVGPRLEHIEKMVTDIYSVVFQSVQSGALQHPPGLEPGPGAHGPLGDAQFLAAPTTPSVSRARRLRSKKTRRKLWWALNGDSDEDPPRKKTNHPENKFDEKYKSRHFRIRSRKNSSRSAPRRRCPPRNPDKTNRLRKCSQT